MSDLIFKRWQILFWKHLAFGRAEHPVKSSDRDLMKSKRWPDGIIFVSWNFGPLEIRRFVYVPPTPRTRWYEWPLSIIQVICIMPFLISVAIEELRMWREERRERRRTQ